MAITSPVVLGVPVPAVSVEPKVSVGPLVSTAVVEDATKRTSHNMYSEVVPPLVVEEEYVPVVGLELKGSVDPLISAEVDDDSAPEQNIVYNKLLTSGS